MAVHYLPPGDPDPEDFFAQIVPTPPPTDHAGGVVFMAPLDPAAELWFAYCRHGSRVTRVDGTRDAVEQWALEQPVAERWVYAQASAAYVRWSDRGH